MSVSVAYNNSNAALTVSGTELSLVSGTSSLQAITTAGYYAVLIDGVSAGLAKGDRFRVTIKEKGRTGGTQRIRFQGDIYGVQSQTWESPPVAMLNGWDITIQKISGTDRSFDYTIYKAG